MPKEGDHDDCSGLIADRRSFTWLRKPITASRSRPFRLYSARKRSATAHKCRQRSQTKKGALIEEGTSTEKRHSASLNGERHINGERHCFRASKTFPRGAAVLQQPWFERHRTQRQRGQRIRIGAAAFHRPLVCRAGHHLMKKGRLMETGTVFKQAKPRLSSRCRCLPTAFD